MQIALIGGTGDIGEGLALRLGRDTAYGITIGSRDERRAVTSARTYRDAFRDRNVDPRIGAATNANAAADADVVVLAVPPYYAEETVERIASGLDGNTILVSPAVGMKDDGDGLRYHPPSTGSVAELIAETAPDDVAVVGACANLPAKRLADLDEAFTADTLLVGDDSEAKDVVASLEGLRPLDSGPLANAPEVGSLTPLLINIARYNENMEHVCVMFNSRV